MKRTALLVLALGSFAAGTTNAEPVTTGSLVEEMVDMGRLTMRPDPFYKTVQYSSYDRRSTLPGGRHWFTNSDGFGGEPVPNFEAVVREPDDQGVGEYLVCDVDGPGAIVRTWSALMVGAIRLYLDDAAEPVFDGPAQRFLTQTYADYAAAAGLDDGTLEGTFFQRNAAYCPIPFAKRCRIVWQGNLKGTHFYQVQIRLYEPDAQVATFRPDDLKKYKKTMRRVAHVLAAPDKAWKYASKATPLAFALTVPPGAKESALSIEGPKAVERLVVSVKADDLDKALRQTEMYIACERYPWGQVQAPVGDFFGAAPGINPYTSLPFTVTRDGAMTCRYVMPFEATFQLLFENRGEQPVEVTGEALPMDYAWDAERSMHFRAKWRVDHGILGAGAYAHDMPYLVANGAGLYVGTAVFVMNPNEVPTSGGNWWGEGDEKIFVDDDVRPSTFGTGSEDYFNYAWSSNDIFEYPYCGQPRNDGPANRGFVTNHRWHILDPLPFEQRLSFYMELFTAEKTPGISYARIAYHYARPGLMDDHVLITDEDLRTPKRPRGWLPAARGAATHAVFFQAHEVLEAGEHVRVIEGDLWSAGKLCVWTPEAVGEELTFVVPVAEAGKHDLRIGFALDPQAGAVSLRVNDEDAKLSGGVADLYVPYRTLLRNKSTRPLKLKPGDCSLTLRYEGGRDDVADKTIGIDYIWLQKR